MRPLNSYKLTLAENIRTARTAKGITQAQLSEASGVARSSISSIEQGDGNPSIDLLYAVAEVLDIDFEFLFVSDVC